jgi:hypothetical protein
LFTVAKVNALCHLIRVGGCSGKRTGKSNSVIARVGLRHRKALGARAGVIRIILS